MDSLVAPQDKRPYTRTSPQPPLTEDQTGEAVRELVKDMTFIRVDRRFNDPPIMDQKIVLVSFVPSKGAKPDADNIYGMMKVRGVFPDEEEANKFSEHIIRDVDSLHEIYHAWVGRPFPVTTATGFEKELKTIDIRKKTVDLISEDILSKRRQDEKDLREIQDKEKRLLDESKRAKEDLPEDPFDVYITEQVKRAQLIWTFIETRKKMQQMRDIIDKTSESIRSTEQENPDYVVRYKDKYMQARREAGIKDDDNSFLKFLGQDNLDTILLDNVV